MLNLELPFNSLSFGNISYGLTKEMFARGINPNIFPIGQNQFEAYDKAPQGYFDWVNQNIAAAPSRFNKNFPSLKLWHINGSWQKVSEPSFLLTFFELDRITESEKNILNSYAGIFVTSEFTKNVFQNYGVTTPTYYVPMGYDESHFNIKNKKYLEDCVVFTIIGKAEKRKHTKTAIQGWIKKFGGNAKFRLHVAITNPFMSPEEMNGFFAEVFENKVKPFNIDLFGWQKTNSEVNELINATDVICDLSGGEALSLPTLTALCLGKHAVVHNCTAMLDYCNNDNAVLVSSKGQIPCYDGKFFTPNSLFNQGNIFIPNEEEYINALDIAVERVKKNKINVEGFKLKDKFSYKNGADIILDKMNIL